MQARKLHRFGREEYLNVLTEAVDWVQNAVEERRNARRTKRRLKTPCRKNRLNRSRGGLAPSIKARWGWKLRNLNWLNKMFPITDIAVEDIKAKTLGKKRWDKTFTPLQMGKTWFYSQVRQFSKLTLKLGWETKALRDELELKKSSKKLADKFECHNVDSWVLAWSVVGGNTIPENKKLLKIVPLRFHRHRCRLPENGSADLSFPRNASAIASRRSV